MNVSFLNHEKCWSGSHFACGCNFLETSHFRDLCNLYWKCFTENSDATFREKLVETCCFCQGTSAVWTCVLVQMSLSAVANVSRGRIAPQARLPPSAVIQERIVQTTSCPHPQVCSTGIQWRQFAENSLIIIYLIHDSTLQSRLFFLYDSNQHYSGKLLIQIKTRSLFFKVLMLVFYSDKTFTDIEIKFCFIPVYISWTGLVFWDQTSVLCFIHRPLWCWLFLS